MDKNLSHPAITPEHLRKRAVCYLRQSTQKQVAENDGATDFQRQQVRHARALGWMEDLIEVNDEDLGLSGSGSDHRPGYLKLLNQVISGVVGAIFVSEMSRLGRDAAEMLQLVTACRKHRVLFIINGQVSDPRDDNQRFMQQMNSIVAEYENVRRRDMMHRARTTKAEKGSTVSVPPAGYVRVEKGKWGMDPDSLVQNSIRAVFRALLEGRSLKRAVDILIDRGVKLPTRKKNGIVEWRSPTIGRVYRILLNPAYKGEYVYPQRKVDHARGRGPAGFMRVRRALPEERIVRPNNHPAYVSEAEWTEVQAILQANARTSTHGNLGPGSALLQGIVKCGIHACRAMPVHYLPRSSAETAKHYYACQGDYHSGGRQCTSTPGSMVDRAVLREARKRLSVPAVEVVRERWNVGKADARAEQDRRLLALNKVRRDEAEARNRALSVNADNVLVRQDLEKLWEEKKRELMRLETGLDASSPADVFTPEMWDELLRLVEALDAVLDADTTTMRDRKELIRCMINFVVIEDRTDTQVTVRIVWANGEADTVLTVPLSRHAYTVIDELIETGRDLEEVVQELGRRGILTAFGNPWTVTTLRNSLKWRRAAPGQRVRKRIEAPPATVP